MLISPKVNLKFYLQSKWKAIENKEMMHQGLWNIH